jgi:hypothetical protein
MKEDSVPAGFSLLTSSFQEEPAMRHPLEIHSPVPALGMTSLVLGVIALLLAFLPVLGIPLAGFGALLGVFGLLAGVVGATGSLRWTLAGLAISLLALGVNYAVHFAPQGYMARPTPPPIWRSPQDRPYVPPPAR